MPDVDSITSDAAWFPHRFQPDTESIVFVRLTREAHRALPFLGEEYIGTAPERRTLPVSLLKRSPPSPLHFVFHSAFCCSTLLARALDVPGKCFTLKEPKILNDLAGAAFRGELSDSLLDLVLSLLSRPFDSGEQIVVKPSNETNVLIESIMRLRPDLRAVLLSSELSDFLLSIAKKGMWGRIWGRRIYAQLRPYQRLDPGFSPAETFQQTDLQIAAMAWLIQRCQFVDLLAQNSLRVRSLEGAAMLRDNVLTLRRASEFFSLSLTWSEIDGILAKGVFSEHSKEPGRDYDSGRRIAEQAALSSVHGEEIAMIVQWTAAVAAHIGVPMTFDSNRMRG